jgi:hypothetical protein
MKKWNKIQGNSQALPIPPHWALEPICPEKGGYDLRAGDPPFSKRGGFLVKGLLPEFLFFGLSPTIQHFKRKSSI